METWIKKLYLRSPSWPGLRPLLSLSLAAGNDICSLLCWSGLLQGEVQNVCVAMAWVEEPCWVALMNHCLLQVWVAGDRQVAAFPPSGGLVTFPGESGVAWVGLEMPGP